MKVYVVNAFYNAGPEPYLQISRIFLIDKDGQQKEVQREQISYEQVGTVVLACEDESKIMETLQANISSRITNFELISETDLLKTSAPLAPPIEDEGGSGQAGKMAEGKETEPPGKIIFQSGI